MVIIHFSFLLRTHSKNMFAVVFICLLGLSSRTYGGILSKFIADKPSSKTDLDSLLRKEEESRLLSQLEEFRISCRILTDQITFLRGNVNYHKRIALEAMREKEGLKQILASQMSDLESKHQEAISEVRRELKIQNEEEMKKLRSKFEIEKTTMLESLKISHAKEIKAIKEDFRQQLEEKDFSLSELKAKLREKSRITESSNKGNKAPLSSSSSSPKSNGSAVKSVITFIPHPERRLNVINIFLH